MSIIHIVKMMIKLYFYIFKYLVGFDQHISADGSEKAIGSGWSKKIKIFSTPRCDRMARKQPKQQHCFALESSEKIKGKETKSENVSIVPNLPIIPIASK